MSNLNFLCCLFFVFNGWSPERKRSPPIPVLPPLRSWRWQWGNPSAFSSPHWTNQGTSTISSKSCLSPSWSPFSGQTLIVCCPPDKTALEMRSLQCRAEWDNSPPLPGCDAVPDAPEDMGDLPGCQDTADYWNWPPYLFFQGCFSTSAPQFVSTTKIISSQMENPALGLIKFHVIRMRLSIRDYPSL